jgi:hypothetical protein
MAWLHGAPGQVRRVAVGVAMAVATLLGPFGGHPVHGATRDDLRSAPTAVTTDAGPAGAGGGAPDARPSGSAAPQAGAPIELRVDYGVARRPPSGRDPAMTALVIAAGAHLIGVGLWAVTRVAQVRRDERALVHVGTRRHGT